MAPSGNQKIALTLEINAKGEAVLKTTKKAVDELSKSLGELVALSREAKKADHDETRARKESAKETKAKKRAVDGETKATAKNTRAQKRNKRGLKDVGDEAGKTRNRIMRLSRGFEKLSNTIGLGVIKAQLFSRVLGGAFRIGASVVTAPLRLLNSGLQTLVKSTIQATEKFDKFRITLEGALKDTVRARQITEFTQEFALRTPVRVEEIQNLTKSIALIPALKPTFSGEFGQVKKDLGDLYNTVIGLASLDPQQGIPGAVFAIREALGGQFRSLRARFEIMPEIIAGSIDKTLAEIKRSPQLVIQALKQFVDESVGEETIRKLGELPSVRIGNIFEALKDIAPRQIGTAGFQEFIQNLLGGIDDAFQSFFKAGGDFESKFAPQISESLQRIVIAGLEIVNSIFGGAAGSQGVQPGLEGAAQVLTNVLKSVAETAERIARSFKDSPGKMKLFFDNIAAGVSNVFGAVTEFAEQLPTLMVGFSAFMRGISAVVAAIIGAAASITKAVGDLVMGAAEMVPSTVAPGLHGAARAARQRVFDEQSAGGVIERARAMSPTAGSLHERIQIVVSENFPDASDDMPYLGFGGPTGMARGGIEALIKRHNEVEELISEEKRFSGGGGLGINFGLHKLERERDQIVKALNDPDWESKLDRSSTRSAIQEVAFRKVAIEELQKKLVDAGTGMATNFVDEANRAAKAKPGGGAFFGIPDIVTTQPRTREDLNLERLQGIQAGARQQARGAIAGLQRTGLTAIGRLEKTLLGPLEREQNFIRQTQERFTIATDKLAVARERQLLDIVKATPITGGKLGAQIGIEGLVAGDAAAAVEEQVAKATAQSRRLASAEQLEPIGRLVQLLGSIDPTNTERVSEVTTALFEAINKTDPVKVEGVGDVLLGTVGVRGAAAQVIRERVRAGAEAFRFSPGRGDPRAQLDARRQALESSANVFGPILGRLPEGERIEFNKELNRLIGERLKLIADEERLIDLTQEGEARKLEAAQLLAVERFEDLKRQTEFGAVVYRNFLQGMDNVTTQFGDNVRTTLGDTIFAAFTGDLDNISQIWKAFLNSLLRSVSDTLGSQLFGILKKLLGLALGGPQVGDTSVGPGGEIFTVVQNPNTGALFSTGTGTFTDTENFSRGTPKVGPTAGGPVFAMIGEGSTNEAVIPLTSGNSIPASYSSNGLVANLPGGRSVPISVRGLANGGVVPSMTPVSMPDASQGPTIIIANSIDEARIVAAGLPANTAIIENQIGASMRNRSTVGKATKRLLGRR